MSSMMIWVEEKRIIEWRQDPLALYDIWLFLEGEGSAWTKALTDSRWEFRRRRDARKIADSPNDFLLRETGRVTEIPSCLRAHLWGTPAEVLEGLTEDLDLLERLTKDIRSDVLYALRFLKRVVREDASKELLAVRTENSQDSVHHLHFNRVVDYSARGYRYSASLHRCSFLIKVDIQ